MASDKVRSAPQHWFSQFSDAAADQEVVAKLAEVDMIVADLERANSRVVTVERRNVRPRFGHFMPYWAH